MSRNQSLDIFQNLTCAFQDISTRTSPDLQACLVTHQSLFQSSLYDEIHYVRDTPQKYIQESRGSEDKYKQRKSKVSESDRFIISLQRGDPDYGVLLDECKGQGGRRGRCSAGDLFI